MILLDAYRCHMMQLVVSKIVALGVDVIHIPVRCTGLCQPLDIGINKMIKQCCLLMWEYWMMNMINTISEIREATCKEVAAWTAEVYWDMMGNKLLKNAWRKTGYDWFEGVVEDEHMDSDGDKDNDNKTHNDCNDDNDNKAHDDGEDNEEWEDWEEDGAKESKHEYFSSN